jgi:hypothetical protein
MQKTVGMLAALVALGVMAGGAWAEVGTGSVQPESGWFPAGTNLTATATPDANSAFDAWSGDTNSATFGAGTITFTVDGPKTITARFAHIMHIITASAGENGSITPSGPISVKQGDSPSFAIAANPNYDIDDVLVDGSSVGAVSSYTFNEVMNAHTIAASFKLKSYTVTFDLGTFGTFVDTGAPLVQTVTHGSAATAPDFTVAASHTFTGWDTAFDNVTANITVTAQYAIKTYTLIYLAGANGSITGNTNQTGVAHGSSGTAVTAVPVEGYHFVKWDDDVMTASRTDANVTADLTVTASFAQNQYSFVVYSERGTSNPAAGTTNWHAHGATVDFAMADSPVIIPSNTMYVATGWVGTGSAPATGTETNGFFVITENSTLTWQWSTNYWIELNVATE